SPIKKIIGGVCEHTLCKTDYGALAWDKIETGLDMSAAKITGDDSLVLKVSEITAVKRHSQKQIPMTALKVRDHRNPDQQVRSERVRVPGKPDAEKRIFDCKVEGNNDGCQTVARCMRGRRITSIKAACNLEFGEVSLRSVQALRNNTVAVLREIDSKKKRSECLVGKILIREGTASLSSQIGKNGVLLRCKEYDKNGGDCHIKAEMVCER
ncbi:MAG: hypothetical protein AAF613_07555, partial [Pseudomonadota bacterium]